MTANPQDLRLGDTVRGEYHGAEFVGIIDSHDGSYLYVRLLSPIVVCRESRDRVAIAPYERNGLTVVSRPELDFEDVSGSYSGAGLTRAASDRLFAAARDGEVAA